MTAPPNTIASEVPRSGCSNTSATGARISAPGAIRARTVGTMPTGKVA